jgi:hypothetical protein
MRSRLKRLPDLIRSSMPKEPEHPARTPYFVNGWCDVAAIGGLSIVVFLALRLVSEGQTTQAAIQVAATMSIFVNYPHFSATLYRLYQSPDNIRQFPVTSFGVPLLLIGAVAASVWQPERIAPYLVTLFLIWSPFHYSGQTIGITMLYARRGSYAIDRWQRLALSAFVYSTFIVSFTHAVNSAPMVRYGVNIPIIHFPGWFDAITIAVLCAGAAGLIYFAFSWVRAHGRIPPAIVFLPALTQFVWFLPGRQTAMFYEFVPLFHSLQYLYIAWAMQIGLRLREPAAGAPRSLLKESCRWALSNYVGGMLLFIALPWLLFWVDLPLVTSAGIVIAAVNIHHFFVDGVIWKLRNVGATSPLMLNIADWLPRRAPVPAIP